jgi:beta-carotene 15,15'-monooxygenase
MGTELGFGSIEGEVTASLDVEGRLPPWLSGSLIRNGPGSFRVGEDGREVDHWFDGLAMLRKFTFRGGEVSYQNRFLRTDTYRKAQRGTFEGGFATGGAGLLDQVRSLVFEDTYDNTNVITEQVGDRYLAMTETPRWTEFDPGTLDTLGSVEYAGEQPAGQLACAHVHHDPWTGRVLNLETEFGRTSRYHVYEMAAPTDREHVATVPVEEPAYMHSFAATRRYVVLTEFPFVIDPLDFLRPGGDSTFIDNFRWEPDRATRLVVIDRRSGGVVAEPRVEPFFSFHGVNAYEDGDEIVLDVETVPDTESIRALYLEELRQAGLDVFGGKFDRFRVQPSARGEPTVEHTEIYEGSTGLPTVSPAVRMREHRYAYAQGADQPATDWPHAVVKVDCETGDVREFEREDTYLSEPIFVPRPDGDREDDGVVLSVGLDTGAERSVLYVLDGETLAERARAPLPHALPFDFHGRFFPELTG